MSLSDKAYSSSIHESIVYKKEDVKQFIKDLKKYGNKQLCINNKAFNLGINLMLDRINELAGDDLK